MKQFVKALDKDGACFQYISDAFPGLSEKKKKIWIFDGPLIRQLIQDKNFAQSMTPVERDIWLSFVLATKNFLGNTKASNYVHLVNDTLEKCKRLNVHMSIKMHFLFSHLDRFSENLRAVSDEEGEIFHQDIKVIEQLYQGRWDIHMMVDYCWTITRDNISSEHKRKSKKTIFVLEPWEKSDVAPLLH